MTWYPLSFAFAQASSAAFLHHAHLFVHFFRCFHYILQKSDNLEVAKYRGLVVMIALNVQGVLCVIVHRHYCQKTA
jgi:hypothetical protein